MLIFDIIQIPMHLQGVLRSKVLKTDAYNILLSMREARSIRATTKVAMLVASILGLPVIIIDHISIVRNIWMKYKTPVKIMCIFHCTHYKACSSI